MAKPQTPKHHKSRNRAHDLTSLCSQGSSPFGLSCSHPWSLSACNFLSDVFQVSVSGLLSLCSSLSYLDANHPLNPRPTLTAPTGLFTAPRLAHSAFLTPYFKPRGLLTTSPGRGPQLSCPSCFVMLLAQTWLACSQRQRSTYHCLHQHGCHQIRNCADRSHFNCAITTLKWACCCSAVTVRFPRSLRPPFS